MSKILSTIYLHLRKDTKEVFYVGIGYNSKRPYSRKHRNKHWHSVVNKYGYEVKIIGKNLTWENACKLEISLIKKYGRKDLGLGNLVNKTNGGEGTPGFKHSEEYLNSIKGSGNPMYGKRYTEKEKKIISERQMGDKNHFYGKTHSESTKKKLSELAKEQFKNKENLPCIKPVLNCKTGEIYVSMKEASLSIGRSLDYLRPRLNGKRFNDTNLELLHK